MRTAKTIDEQLADGMAKAQEVGDCLEWQGYMANHGTQPAVKLRAAGKSYADNIGVPKLLWEQANGPVPEGKLVYRKCCNNACVLLDHIAVGTREEWFRARKRAGANKHSPSTLITLTLAARRRATTVNTAETARLVRHMAAAGMKQADVARETGVSEAMVADIVTGRAWRDLSSPFAGLMR